MGLLPASSTPLTLSNVDAGEGCTDRTDAIQQEVRAAVTGVRNGRALGVVAAVSQGAKVAVVVGGGIVVLVAQGLRSDGDQMPAALPGEAVDVTVGVVDQSAAVDGVSTGEKAAVDVLVRIAVIPLVGEVDSNLGVARGSEFPG